MQTETLGQRVRRAREARQLKGNELGRKVGSKPGYISRLESGFIEAPGYEKLKLLAKALNVSVEWLAEGTGADPFKAPKQGEPASA